MPPSAITAAHFAHKLAVQGPGGFGELVKAWIDYLNSQVAGNPEFNGSFEIDSDADGDPDLWTMDIYTGGAYELDTTDSSHGKTSLKFTHPGGAGNGGGWADSDYLEASELIPYVVPFLLKNSAAGTKVEVVIRCFDEDKIDLSSDQTIYSSVANPTAWTLKFADVTLAAGTKFIKIRLIGGKSDVDVAGTVRFDGIALLRGARPYAAGDILLQSSDTARTESNGNYIKHKEMQLTRGGTLRIKFGMSNAGSYAWAYGRIYRNGVAVGTEQNTRYYITFSEDISGWSQGDLCQIYIKAQSNITTVDNFRVYSNVAVESPLITYDM